MRVRCIALIQQRLPMDHVDSSVPGDPQSGLSAQGRSAGAPRPQTRNFLRRAARGGSVDPGRPGVGNAKYCKRGSVGLGRRVHLKIRTPSPGRGLKSLWLVVGRYLASGASRTSDVVGLRELTGCRGLSNRLKCKESRMHGNGQHARRTPHATGKLYFSRA